MISNHFKYIIFLVFFIMLVNDCPALDRRIASRQKICFSNIRVFQGAVEMYNLDHELKVKDIIPGRDYEEFEKILINEGYLKDVLYHVEDDCSYGFVDILGSGSAFCKRHGVVESPFDGPPILPNYDRSLERPFTYEYSKKEEKRDREKKIRNFGLDLLSYFIGFLPFFIFLYLVFANKKREKNID